MKKKFILLLLFIALNISCAKKQEKQDLIVFHAGSLSVPFKEIESVFEKVNPDIDIKREVSGSRSAARKISELKRPCDIMASADYSVIELLLIPDYADWNISFASNEMSIMYTEKSKYKDIINKDNWYEILLRSDVEYGHSDPNADPCGYRSLLCWQLAEKFYKKTGLYNDLIKACPLKNVRPKETDLLALLETGELDYLFIYKSVAMQHHEKYLVLPEQISLKNNIYNNFYNQASIEISGKTPGTLITKKGQAMVYGITIPKNAPNYKTALKFVVFLLSDQGKKIMKKNGQGVIFPAKSGQRNNVPKKLKKYIK